MGELSIALERVAEYARNEEDPEWLGERIEALATEVGELERSIRLTAAEKAGAVLSLRGRKGFGTGWQVGEIRAPV